MTFFENPSAGAGGACTCSCGAPSSNPCYDPLKIYVFDVRIGTGACDQTGSVSQDGACHDGGSWSSSVTGLSGTPGAPRAVACAASAALPAIAADARFDVCAAPPGACVPEGTGACVSRAGDASCPAAFPVRHLVTAEADLDDTRACGACTCLSEATACTNATLTLYTTDDCAPAGAHVATLNGTCNAYDGDFSLRSYRYAASPSPPGCAATSETTFMTGGVASKQQTTLCCL
jgi:hypothetical protein